MKIKRFAASCLSMSMVCGGLTVFPVSAQEASPKLLAEFSFEQESENGFTCDGAKAEGTYTITESYEGSGNALHLSADENQFLSVTKSDGSSLLSGVEEMTVSYDIKNERPETNWALFAAPDNAVPGYNNEHYIGFLHKDGKLTLERYNNTVKRPSNPEVLSEVNKWTHIDAVFTEEKTTVYVNGVEQADVESEYTLPDILGNESILYIGKATWGTGEYTTASVDNLRIWDRAMDKDELIKYVPESFMPDEFDKVADEITDLILENGTAVLPDHHGLVTWKTDMPEIQIADDGITAQVKAPAPGEDRISGEMTAVIRLGALEKEVTVSVTIKAQAQKDDPYGYLMVHFIEDSAGYAEKMYLDISRGDNPEQWDPLNGGKPILASNLGTTGARDPFLTYSPETETYYILATDLRVFGGDGVWWDAWTNNYSTKLNIWESKDLITWSDVRQIDLNMEDGKKQADIGMMWAPEATWVPDYYGEGKGAFVVYWTSQVYADEAQTIRTGEDIMWGATPDFTQDTWEYGGMFPEGGPAGWIDTDIIRDGDKTYHITKSNAEQIIMEMTTAKDWWNYETTEWTRIQSNIGVEKFGAVEGPCAFKDHSEENRWYLFVDDMPSPGYRPMVSTDLDRGWEYLDSSQYFLTEFTKHGGVLSLTKAQYDEIRNADAVSAVKEDLGITSVCTGSTKEQILAALPGKAQVNLAYDMGYSELPVKWDISSVETDKEGIYDITGIVQSISANKDAWKGDGGSESYLAENKKLYSSNAITVKAQVKVEEPEFTEIIIASGPDKTEYIRGEDLDLTGMSVKAKYSDGKTCEIQEGEDGYTVSGYDAEKTGEQEITVTYNGKTAVFKVMVKEAQDRPSGQEEQDKPSGQEQQDKPDDAGKQEDPLSSGRTDPAAEKHESKSAEEESGKAVQTGDTTAVAFPATGICTAAALAIVYRKRKGAGKNI